MFLKKVWGSETWDFMGSFLVKRIDARRDLSLQVHPPDAYARRVERQPGKAESWLILDVAQGAKDGFIYIGFRPRKNLRSAFARALQHAQAKDILSFVHRVRVRPGEVYHLPPGTIHAVGGGVRLFEIQQPSRLTYRVWDWNRPGKRELHLKKAFDVLSFRPRPRSFFRQQPTIFQRGPGWTEEKLIHEKKAGYAAHRIRFREKNARLDDKINRLWVLTVTKGAIGVEVGRKARTLRAGNTLAIPKGSALTIWSESPRAEVIKSFCP
jgi:mannose-6-phosphate isomerase